MVGTRDTLKKIIDRMTEAELEELVMWIAEKQGSVAQLVNTYEMLSSPVKFFESFPEARDVVYVDGGCDGNGTEHARGYGSYKIGADRVMRLKLPEAHTNNEAEYWSLIHALAELDRRNLYGAEIRMDSSLVVNQVNRSWKVKDPRMRSLCDQAQAGLADAAATLVWIRRDEIESVLGH